MSEGKIIFESDSLSSLAQRNSKARNSTGFPPRKDRLTAQSKGAHLTTPLFPQPSHLPMPGCPDWGPPFDVHFESTLLNKSEERTAPQTSFVSAIMIWNYGLLEEGVQFRSNRLQQRFALIGQVFSLYRERESRENAALKIN